MLLLRILTLGLLAHHGAAAPTEGQATDLSDHHHLQSRSPDEPAHIPQDTAELVPNSWIIHLKDNAEKSPAEHAAWATKIHEEYPQGLKGVHLIMNWHNTKTYGYAGDFADKTIDKIRKDKDVEAVYQNVAFPDLPTQHYFKEQEKSKRDDLRSGDYLDENAGGKHKAKRAGGFWDRPSNPGFKLNHPTRNIDRDIGRRVIEQTDAPWGLGRISKAPSGRYHYKQKAGEGTYIYVLDSGIDTEHEEFEGRAEFGFDATLHAMKNVKPRPQTMFHGTVVASIAAGAKLGVAKKARVIDVKVLRDNEEERYANNAFTLTEGFNWAVDDIISHNRVGYSIINLSLGRPQKPWGEQEGCYRMSVMVNEAIRQGIHVVIAAGNEDMEAAKMCPANTQPAITVGAVDVDNKRWVVEKNVVGSNWGSHVDIFAPGVDVEAALAFTGSETLHVAGTSAAAPHVTGVIACLIADEGPRSPEDMWKRLEKLSQKKKVKNPRRSQNRLLYNGVNG